MCALLRNTEPPTKTVRRPAFGVAAGLSLLLLSGAVVFGQARETDPAPAEPAQSASTGSESADRRGLFESETLLRIIDRTFDPETDAFDPEEGSMTWKNRTFAVGDSRLFRARFERYLDTPDSDLERNVEYEQKLEEIFRRLSTGNRESIERNLNEAWEMLFAAGEYEADSGNSLVIANMVYNAWRVRDQHRSNALSRTQLEYDRRVRERRIVNRDRAAADFVMARREQLPEILPNEGSNVPKIVAGGSAPSATPPSLSEADFEARDLGEIQGRIQALETSSAVTAQQVKLQFQSQILSFFFQRRFQHALIATSFYRMIFKGSAQGLEVGEKQLKEFMPDSDLVPSIDTLDFLAREALADVGGGMAAVRTAYEEGRLVNALERLQETFFLGEHTPMVRDFKYEERQTLLRLYKKMRAARKLVELKDYDQVETLADEIGTLAQDFEVTEALSGIRSIKRMSNLALFSAQQGIAAGDTAKAAEGLAQAAKMWPLNPALDSFTRELSSKVDVSGRAAATFDDMYQQNQYRRIFDRRAELMPGVFGDVTRSERMHSVIDRIGRIDMLVAQSREMMAQENRFAAWEMLVAAAEIDPNDVVVNREQAQLAPSVARFVGILDEAQRREREEAFAISLSRYLEARRIYPASRLARQGIERVGERLMDRIAVEESGLARAADPDDPPPGGGASAAGAAIETGAAGL